MKEEISEEVKQSKSSSSSYFHGDPETSEG
jgi:hypothetical protein